jgi:hypothetical protein
VYYAIGLKSRNLKVSPSQVWQPSLAFVSVR